MESHGFQCWTDVSNANKRYAIGHAPDPADSLQTQIQRKIKGAVAVVCCVTPKYICSENCTKDLSIAESMKKPIVPVMLQWLAWPPEGGRARRILAPLSCIDMSNNNLFKRNLSTFEIYLKKCASKHNTWWFRRTKWVHSRVLWVTPAWRRSPGNQANNETFPSSLWIHWPQIFSRNTLACWRSRIEQTLGCRIAGKFGWKSHTPPKIRSASNSLTRYRAMTKWKYNFVMVSF